MSTIHMPAHVPAHMLAVVLVATAAVVASAQQANQVAPAGSRTADQHLYFPEEVRSPPWLPARRDAQLATAAQLQVPHTFVFTDTQPDSGIAFRHHIVDDSGYAYVADHYDHGNGIAVADVDSDGLLDVYLVSQAGPNGLYRNLGKGRFEDVTARAGVAVAGVIGATASFADVDNDGDADLYVTNVRSPNRLFENDGSGRFRDVSDTSGIDFSGYSSAAVFFDYDRDGHLDLFLCVVGEYTTEVRRPLVGASPASRAAGFADSYLVGHRDAFAGHLKSNRLRASRLFRNRGDGRFVDVTQSTGLIDAGWTGDATPTDFNNDGWPDLYVLNMQGHDAYWVNDNGRRFVARGDTVFPRTPWGSMGVKTFDFDNDGDQDLLLSDMHSDMSENVGVAREKRKADWIVDNWSAAFLRSNGRSIYGNALYRNDGNDRFTEISDVMNVENYWPWGVSVGDLNADGWLDVLFTASMNYPFRYVPNSVLLNDGGRRFVDAEYILGIEPRRGGRTSTPWIRLNCDGADNGHADCKDRHGELVVHGALGSRSSALFDLDQDGDLDIVTNEFGEVPQVLISSLVPGPGADGMPRWIEISLRGTTSNRDGLGARVTVVAAGQRFVQVYDGKSGYLAQSRMPLYFGLGRAQSINHVEVSWPSGHTQRYTQGLAVGGRVVLTESR